MKQGYSLSQHQSSCSYTITFLVDPVQLMEEDQVNIWFMD